MQINFKNFKINDLKPKTDFEKKVVGFLQEWFSEGKTVQVQTSGSTGTPKIFEVEKSRKLSSAEITCDFLGLKEGDSALLCLPIEYISGKMMVVRSIERKLKLHISEPSTKPLENLNERIDFCAMTPLQVENSLDKIHLIEKLIIGGAEVSSGLKKKLSQISNLKSQIFETYGMSETLSHIALKEVYPNAENYFKVLENVEISIDERSCLRIFAPKLNSEILQTNDIVELRYLDSARFDNEFRFLGRMDNVINSGGAKIFPEELENFVKRHLVELNIASEIVFIGIPDEKLGQKLVLIIEDASTPLSMTKEINHLISLINYEKSFQKPKEIIFVKEIPRTPNGKIDRIALKQHIASLRSK